MFDVGDHEAMRMPAVLLTFFNVFFSKSKNMTFFELLHTYSRTLLCSTDRYFPTIFFETVFSI